MQMGRKTSITFLILCALISSLKVNADNSQLVQDYVAHADHLYDIGKYQQAITEASEALKLDKNNAVAFRIKAKAELALGKYGAALNDAKKAVALGEKSAIATQSAAEAKLQEEDEAYNHVAASLDANQLQRFIDTNPNSRHMEEARQLLNEVKLWNNAKETRAFHTYLQNTKLHKFDELANKNIERLEQEQREAEQREAEQCAWDSITNSYRDTELNQYLYNYPTGQHADIARARIQANLGLTEYNSGKHVIGIALIKQALEVTPLPDSYIFVLSQYEQTQTPTDIPNKSASEDTTKNKNVATQQITTIDKQTGSRRKYHEVYFGFEAGSEFAAYSMDKPVGVNVRFGSHERVINATVGVDWYFMRDIKWAHKWDWFASKHGQTLHQLVMPIDLRYNCTMLSSSRKIALTFIGGFDFGFNITGSDEMRASYSYRLGIGTTGRHFSWYIFYKRYIADHSPYHGYSRNADMGRVGFKLAYHL